MSVVTLYVYVGCHLHILNISNSFQNPSQCHFVGLLKWQWARPDFGIATLCYFFCYVILCELVWKGCGHALWASVHIPSSSKTCCKKLRYNHWLTPMYSGLQDYWYPWLANAQKIFFKIKQYDYWEILNAEREKILELLQCLMLQWNQPKTIHLIK